MMVDTINPNTNEPDVLSPTPGNNIPTVPPASEARFYGGFDKPSDVNINLASQQPATPVPPRVAPVDPVSPASQPMPQTAPTIPPVVSAPIASDVTPGFSNTETTKHDTYSTVQAPLNVRGLLVIIGLGLLLAIIGGVSTYFVVGAINASNITKEQSQISSLKGNIDSLQQSPAALELPTSNTTTVTTPDTTTTPAVTPTETPAIETPVPTVPTESNGLQSNG